MIRLASLLAAATVAVSFFAQAQPALRILGPAEPEAGFSTTARAVAQAMKESGAASSVETHYAPGKGGLVGLTRFVKEAKGDPSQLMVTGYTTLNSILINNSPVTLRDVTPIARLTADVPFAFLVPAASPIKDARQLAEMLKADPAKVTWAAGSIGGAGHTAVVMFALASGVDASKLNVTVALAGSAVDAVAEGTVMVALGSAQAAYLPLVKKGRLRIIGTTAAQRRPEIDAPTLREQGIDVVFENWRGIVAAPGITDEQRRTLAAAVERMARSDAWKRVLAQNNWVDAYLGGPAFDAFLAREREKAEQAFNAARR
jgi:putative tricarboxylic transport membrane protein